MNVTGGEIYIQIRVYMCVYIYMRIYIHEMQDREDGIVMTEGK